MISEIGDSANRLEKGVDDTWYVFYNSAAVTDSDGRARPFESEVDANACLLRCEAAGRIVD